MPAVANGSFSVDVTLTAQQVESLRAGAAVHSDSQRKRTRRQSLGLARLNEHPIRRAEGSGLIRARCDAVSIRGIIGALLASAAQAQTAGPFTEQQAAAGRTSYQVNCAGCHQADLRGSNEAKPLVGADFLRTWGERTPRS